VVGGGGAVITTKTALGRTGSCSFNGYEIFWLMTEEKSATDGNRLRLLQRGSGGFTLIEALVCYTSVNLLLPLSGLGFF